MCQLRQKTVTISLKNTKNILHKSSENNKAAAKSDVTEVLSLSKAPAKAQAHHTW